VGSGQKNKAPLSNGWAARKKNKKLFPYGWVIGSKNKKTFFLMGGERGEGYCRFLP